MKAPRFFSSLFITIALSASLYFSASLSVLAHERSDVSEQPADVSPLLIGETIPDLTLTDYMGKAVNLRDTAAEKPTIVIFYRGGWCPFCNAQLSQIQQIEKDLHAMGYQILAISPDTPEALAKTSKGRKLSYQLVSDQDLDATRQFGLAFYVPEMYASKVAEIGGKLNSVEGEQRKVLPIPAVFVLDKKGVIQFQYANPNYKVRISSELLLTAAKLAL